MTPLETRNALLAEKLIKNLKHRNITAHYCATASQAVELISSMIGDGSTVTWGGSMTIHDMGLTDALRRRNTLNIIDRAQATTPDEVRKTYIQSFEADYYLTSANAISEDGVIVNIDGNGNRIAAISWGPKRVVFVVGMNKVAQTVDAALSRARSTAAPINAARLGTETPCNSDGCCHNCNSPASICSYVHLLRNSRFGERHIVVLVGENLGY